MLSTAASLAVLTVAGCYVVYNKMPRRVRRFIEKHSLMTDILCLFGVYHLLGGTITALLAAGMVSLVVSGLLHIANHKEQFLYLYDFRDLIKNKIKIIRENLTDYGEQYRQKQLDIPRVQEQEILS